MTANDSASDPVTIIQTYDLPIQIHVDLRNTSWQFYVFLIGVLILLIVANYSCCFRLYFKRKFSIPVTKTEAITPLVDNLPHGTEQLVRLILVDFCGYEQFDYQRYRTSKNKIGRLKQKLVRYQLFGHTLFTLVMMILVATLLSVTYCGYIFLVQNDEYLKRYSIPFHCEVDEHDTCIVDSDAMVYTVRGYGDGPNSHIQWTHHIKYSDYTNFYNDTLIPYLRRLNDSASMQHLEINPALRISIKTQQVSEYSDSTDRKVNGYLYLSENGISDSDFTLSSQKKCDGCGDGFCFTKGDNGNYECYCKGSKIEGDLYQAEHGCSCYCTCCCFWVGLATVLSLFVFGSLISLGAHYYAMNMGDILKNIITELKQIDYDQWHFASEVSQKILLHYSY